MNTIQRDVLIDLAVALKAATAVADQLTWPELAVALSRATIELDGLLAHYPDRSETTLQ